MVDLTSIVGNLERLGFYDFVLPWLLFFAILFGILKTHKMISEDPKLNAIIAAVIAFFIVNFVPMGGISSFYSTTFGVSGMLLGAVLVFVLFAGVLGYKPNAEEGGLLKESKSWMYPVIAILFIAFALIAYMQATGSNLISGIGIDSDTLTIVFILIFVLVIIGYIGKGGEKGKTNETKPPEAQKPAVQ